MTSSTRRDTVRQIKLLIDNIYIFQYQIILVHLRKKQTKNTFYIVFLSLQILGALNEASYQRLVNFQVPDILLHDRPIKINMMKPAIQKDTNNFNHLFHIVYRVNEIHFTSTL